MYTTQRQLRKAFRQIHPHLNFKQIADYRGDGKMFVADTRVQFGDWIDYLQRNGAITEQLAQRVTL